MKPNEDVESAGRPIARAPNQVVASLSHLKAPCTSMYLSLGSGAEELPELLSEKQVCGSSPVYGKLGWVFESPFHQKRYLFDLSTPSSQIHSKVHLLAEYRKLCEGILNLLLLKNFYLVKSRPGSSNRCFPFLLRLSLSEFRWCLS